MSAHTPNTRLATTGILIVTTIILASRSGTATAADKSELQLPRNGFACCNLRYEGDWISDGN